MATHPDLAGNAPTEAVGASPERCSTGHRAWRLIGLILDLPGVRLGTASVYRVIARNRHRLPTPRRDVTV